MSQEHRWYYCALNQLYLAKGKIASVVLLAKYNTRFYMGGSGLDWIEFYRIRTGLGLRNFTVRSSLTPNNQLYQRIWCVQYYSLHAFMV